MVSYVVIGASRGIGLGFVQSLSSDPENIVFASVRNKSTATQLQDFVNSEANNHTNVVVLEADLNDYKSLKTAAKEVSSATQGKLDVLISNGALHERGRWTMDSYPDEETLENDLLSFFKTNVVGTTHAINTFIPLLRDGETKKVLVVSSSMGSTRYALTANISTAGPYAISKAALNMVVAKFATKFRDEGFTFLAVSPGLVKTLPGPPDQVDKIYESLVAQIRQTNPTYPGAISVEQSVKDQLSLLKRITPADTGAFVHANGEDANDPTY
ncbi:hypothetical protein ACEPAI_2059 [Sanghuangporus weigelae]